MTDPQTNVLYYGDHLEILRRYLPDLDPPFDSIRDNNVLFRDESGTRSDAQLLAFEDTRQGPSTESTYRYKVRAIFAALRVR